MFGKTRRVRKARMYQLAREIWVVARLTQIRADILGEQADRLARAL